MLADLQIFATYRWFLAVACAIYTLIVTGQSLRGWLVFFAASRRHAVLGHYTLALLLRVRFRKFVRELTQIVGLLMVLAALVYAHHWLE